MLTSKLKWDAWSKTRESGRKADKLNRRFRASAAAAAIVAVSAAGLIAGNSSPAFATADGCTFFHVIRFAGYTIPGGQYCFGINGRGTTVNFTTGAYQTAVTYNYSEVVRFYDSHNNDYATFYKPVHYGWAYGPQSWTFNIHGTAKAGGRVCGSLTSSGVAIATVCESIS